MARLARFVGDWLHDRTRFRTLLRHLLEEPLPAGTGWWFITGSVLLFLLGIQVATGIVLTMYYVPSPQAAYDSVRYIMDGLPFGRVLRGLHVFGASFIVIAAGVHMVRVVLLGSYKKPREMTWVTGVLLLLVIMGFALTGYLLPWDQKAYWATTVTTNIARSSPLVGEYLAGVMRGGSTLGALTLGRWYAVHVFLLPLALVALVLSHLALMRLHNVSGPITPDPGEPRPFYPFHVIKETIATAVVFAALLTLAIAIPAPLDAVADPSDATYVPRPEWYFLSLFQMLKYFPGPLEPVATLVIPGLVVGGLLLLPWLDRTEERHPAKRPLVMGGFAVLGIGIVGLTLLGLRDLPARVDPSHFGPRAIAGLALAQAPSCLRCHTPGGAASPMDETRIRRDPEWLVAHVADPEVIAPGLRPAPPGGMSRLQGRAILAYLTTLGAGGHPPQASDEQQRASMVFATRCVTCHRIDGDGGATGPDLSHVGQRRDAAWLRTWITDPSVVDADAEMPAFGERLTPEEMTAIVNDLARRK